MYRRILRQSVSLRASSLRCSSFPRNTFLIRGIQTNVDAKYADKLRQRAKEAGLSLQELKEEAKATLEKNREEERKVLKATFPVKKVDASTAPSSPSSTPTSTDGAAKIVAKERKDSSPVKPLSSFLNVERLFSTPHTAEKISSLWTVYHASRSGGTGRGFLCASIPLDIYQKMEGVAQKYPSFVVPIPRPRPESEGPSKEGESDTAYEFFFVQWLFHERPPVPKFDNPFEVPSPQSSTNPQTSTVLVTPLQEYKLRQSFATPYLINTFYTDLATTHNTVLMRGEITPSSAGSGAGPDRYLLSQEDGQILTMLLQKFYLWGDAHGAEGSEAAQLLRKFHEKPEDFKWEDLIGVAKLTA